MKIHSLAFVIILFTIVLCLNRCKKETEENTSSTQLLPKKTNVKVFEAVSVEVKNFDVTDDSLQGSFGNFPIVVYNLKNNLAFVVPDVAEGTYELNLLGQKLSFNVTIQQPVADPDAYVSNLIANITIDNTIQAAIIAKLDSAKARNPAVDVASVVANFNKLQQIKTDAQNQFAALSPAEKQTVAQFFAANKDLLDTLNRINSILADLTLSYKTQGEVEDFDAKVNEQTRKWTVSLSTFLKAAPLSVALGAAVTTITANPVFGVLVGGYCFVKSLSALRAQFEKFQGVPLNAINNFTAYKTTTTIASFGNGVERELSVSNDYTNINSNVLNTMDNYQQLKEFVNSLSDFAGIFNKLNSWFSLGLDGNPQPVSQWTNVVTENKRVHANYLSIVNISNPNVTVTVNNSQGALMLTFNTSAPLPQDFDFDLVYDNPGFARYTKTYSTSISDSASIGNFGYVKMYIDGDTSIYTLSGLQYDQSVPNRLVPIAGWPEAFPANPSYNFIFVIENYAGPNTYYINRTPADSVLGIQVKTPITGGNEYILENGTAIVTITKDTVGKQTGNFSFTGFCEGGCLPANRSISGEFNFKRPY